MTSSPPFPSPPPLIHPRPPADRDPVAVLVMSLIFIGSVFVLHIWGKYTRSAPAATSSA